MLINGDCLEVMRGMEAESVHAVITDPPYELGFMGRAWDRSGIAYSVEMWRECLRVLKPGGFLLAFGGTRTYHRMAVAIEDAGFVINPMLGWIYGSGFPKASDVSKMIDKRAGAEREVVGPNRYSCKGRKPGVMHIGGDNLRPQMEARMAEQGIDTTPITSPATPAAVKWDGWKYSISPLKPALEPICMARKPYDGDPLDSIQRQEVGAVNVKSCAVPTGDDYLCDGGRPGFTNNKGWNKNNMERLGPRETSGRFPPNLCLDPCGAEEVGRQSGESATRPSPDHETGVNCPTGNFVSGTKVTYGSNISDSGTAARFFPIFDHYPEPPFLYQAKAARGEREAGCGEIRKRAAQYDGRLTPIENPYQRNESSVMHNAHPTVKPIALMRWLIRLVTRPGQTVLDPFTGSGSTGCAAALEHRAFIGIEREPDYLKIAEARIKYWSEQPQQMPLFKEEP